MKNYETRESLDPPAHENWHDQFAKDTQEQAHNRLTAPLDKSTLAFLASTSVDSKALTQALAAEYGVSTETDESGKVVFFLPMDGRKQRLPIDAEKPVEAQLNKIIADKAREIEKLFGVRIAPAGEVLSDPGYDARSDWQQKGPEKGKTRAPRLDELMAIELSIRSCEPTQVPGKDQKPLTLYFMEKTFGASHAVAQYDNDFNGTPAVFLYGNKTKGRVIEEPARKSSHDLGSLHRIIVHELAHHAQFKTNWMKAIPEQALTAMGWVKAKGSDSWNDRQYLLQDRDGNKYMYAESAIIVTDDEFIQVSRPTWVKTDDTGKSLKGKDKKFLDPDQMAEIAKVKPVSLYFPNPMEMYAEALTAFRLNESWRAKLIESNRNLYNYVKEQDQIEIDAVHGKGKKIRGTDGRLTNDTPDKRKEIQEFEDWFDKSKK